MKNLFWIRHEADGSTTVFRDKEPIKYFSPNWETPDEIIDFVKRKNHDFKDFRKDD